MDEHLPLVFSVATNAAINNLTHTLFSHMSMSVGRLLHVELLEHIDDILKLPLSGLSVYIPPQPLQMIML